MRNILRPIINKEFTWYLAGRMLFIAGMRMNPVLLGWLLYTKTESKLALGMMGLSEVIPAVLLALPAGVKVDRSDKRNLLRNSMIAYLAIDLLFLFITLPAASEKIGTQLMSWCIYGLIFLTGIIRAYSGPAFNAFLSQLVPTEKLVKATSINSMAWLIAAVAGPTLAGLIFGYKGITVAYLFVNAFVMVGLYCLIQVQSKPITWDPGKTRTWDGVKEGLRFVLQQKALLGAMSLDMFAVLFGGVVAILPVFAKDILHTGPVGLGWLNAATYLGNFIAITWLTTRPLKNGQGRKLYFAVGGFGLCILIFAFSHNYVLSFLALVASGLFDGVSMIIRGTVLQLFVPDTMRGRVSSVYSIFINSSNELGQFESGLAASLMGTVRSVIFGGLMTIGITTFTWYKTPDLKKLEY